MKQMRGMTMKTFYSSVLFVLRNSKKLQNNFAFNFNFAISSLSKIVLRQRQNVYKLAAARDGISKHRHANLNTHNKNDDGNPRRFLIYDFVHTSGKSRCWNSLTKNSKFIDNSNLNIFIHHEIWSLQLIYAEAILRAPPKQTSQASVSVLFAHEVHFFLSLSINSHCCLLSEHFPFVCFFGTFIRISWKANKMLYGTLTS